VIHSERIQQLNDRPDCPGKYVLYWMQQAQRAGCNHALEYAVREADARKLPVVVCFGLTDDFPEANERHCAFMLEGLLEVDRLLRKRGIRFVLRKGRPSRVACELAGKAALVVADRGYLRVQKQWRADAASEMACRLVQVETDVVCPVDVVSDKEEYAARTIRPKIHRHLDDYLVPLEESGPDKSSLRLRLDGLDVQDVDALLRTLKVDRSVGRTAFFTGGESRANQLLQTFVSERLENYAEKRNDPSLGIVSDMSPYLHFGQISPLRIALILGETAGDPNRESYLEELVVRRELSMNFVNQSPDYDAYAGIPEWAQKTLTAHADDPRERLYDLATWEAADTHDPYWNAAQLEMVLTGKMHNYMRMYWGKKIMEWSESPEEAFRIALHLNNKYELDGRDANSFTGVAWCFGKHDRPWARRPVFGTVRYMNANGLKRKFDIEAYVRKVVDLAR
jgi:deoxyribodipyrimidine photo-lyase